jgi:hypothetical protein
MPGTTPLPDTRTTITIRASGSSEKVREGTRGSLVGSDDVLVTAIEESEVCIKDANDGVL